MLGVNVLVLLILQDTVSTPVLYAWVAASSAVALARFLHASYFKARFSPGQPLGRWFGLYLVLLVLQTVLLAAVGILLFPADDFALQLMTILLIVGVASGGSFSLAPYLPAALFFDLTMLAPITYRSWVEPTYPALFPLMFILYAVFLTGSSRLYNRFIIRSLDLKRNNELHTVHIETAQQRLRDSENQLRLITDSIPALVTYIDRDLRYLYVNKGVELSFGQPADYFIGKRVVDIVGEDSFEGVKAEFEKALSGHSVSVEVVREYPVSGRVVGRLDLVPEFDDEARVRGIFSLMTDITKSKQGEEKLKESESRFATAFDANPSMMAIVRVRDTILVNVNRQWCEVMGYSPGDVVNKTIDELNIWVTAEERQRIASSVQDAFSLRNAETRLRTYFGSIIIVDLNIERIEIANEPHLLILANDVTERHKWEEELLQTKEAAEAASRAKSDFLASMSHELRTPLNAIIGFSEFLDREFAGPMNDMQRDYIRDIQKSGDQLLELINDVLDISKIEAGKEDIKNERLQIAEVIESVTALVRDQAAEKQISLTSEINPGCPDIFADRRQMKQILINLLSNAVKFTPPGGKVAIEVALLKAGDKVSGMKFSVIDNGIGIKAEEIPKALAKFEQVEDIFDRQFEGTGLGLPLAVAMTELHGGRLDLQSTYGQGTTVTITLPRERVVGPLI